MTPEQEKELEVSIAMLEIEFGMNWFDGVQAIKDRDMEQEDHEKAVDLLVKAALYKGFTTGYVNACDGWQKALKEMNEKEKKDV